MSETTKTIEPESFEGPQVGITSGDVMSLLCSAFEGGSNYWYTFLEIEKMPNGFDSLDQLKKAREDEGLDYWHWCQLIPCMGGSVSFCEIPLYDARIKQWPLITLDREKLEKGLQLMAEKYPKHWADFISENSDAITGDVFLQLCVFREIRYG